MTKDMNTTTIRYIGCDDADLDLCLKVSMLCLQVCAHQLLAETVEEAFRMSRMVLCCSAYDADIFPPMHQFLHKLQIKTYRSRTVGLVENGSWDPQVARIMRGMLEQMKGITVVEPVAPIRSSMIPKNKAELEDLADEILK